MSDGIIETKTMQNQRQLIAISSRNLIGLKVVNLQGQNLGEIYDVVIDLQAKCIGYGVLSYGGFAGMGNKLFAIPWDAFSIKNSTSFVKGTERQLVLNIPQEALKESDGFKENNWPSSPDYEWLKKVYSRYGFKPYWENGK